MYFASFCASAFFGCRLHCTAIVCYCWDLYTLNNNNNNKNKKKPKRRRRQHPKALLFRNYPVPGKFRSVHQIKMCESVPLHSQDTAAQWKELRHSLRADPIRVEWVRWMGISCNQSICMWRITTVLAHYSPLGLPNTTLAIAAHTKNLDRPTVFTFFCCCCRSKLVQRPFNSVELDIFVQGSFRRSLIAMF